MADLDNLEYFIKFPSPNFNYNQNGEHDFVFVVNEEKIPVILLFGWAGCQDKYLAKYSQIYEEKGLITLRYTAPIKCLFLRRYQMISIGEKLVKLLHELNFDTHPIIVHCFSNGGAFLYQNFSLALEKAPKELPIKGVIFDSAPGRRRVLSLFRAISAIIGGNTFYNFSVSLIMTMFLSMIWLYEVISNTIYPRPTFQSNPLENLKNEKNKWPQCFIYSKNDNLIPYKDIEYFANYRRNLGVDVTSVCYEKSLHVKHLAENRNSYVKTVYNFINKCLNENSILPLAK
ncbi:transmembrane protein 53-A isoform X1 [Diorhabda sublineata]|uniref:transmembrane protein 53-A isoform X1 n=1 Tax=Diorhabda sublineata TaxID=1163346 RepID=UPI0024E0BF51|nr:transmembrane protein 53-A isoform X1 [Diorhabda sublineata]